MRCINRVDVSRSGGILLLLFLASFQGNRKREKTGQRTRATGLASFLIVAVLSSALAPSLLECCVTIPEAEFPA